MAKNSYTNRTTLWDAADADDAGMRQPVSVRGPWRAPSAVLAGEHPANRQANRVGSSLPLAADPARAEEDRSPVTRRDNFAPARSIALTARWWRPQSTFGRVLLASCALMILASVIVAAWAIRGYLIRDPRFRIQGAASIDSAGLNEVNRAEILPIFGSDFGRNVFFVPLAERRRQLESIPWVRQATVMRFLPDRLSVSIVERTPVAFVREGGKIQLADADGVILDMPPAMMAQHQYSFPVLTGIDPNAPVPARRARIAVYLRFLDELDRNNRHLADEISEIDLSDPEDLRATMPAQGSDVLAHFGEDHFLQRLQVYQAHIAEWRGRYPALKAVDLRYNGEVPLEMDAAASANPVPEQSQPNPAKPQPSQPETAKSSPKPPTTKAAPKKSSTPAPPKAAAIKKNSAKLKAEKAKAAKSKIASRKPPAAPRQGQ